MHRVLPPLFALTVLACSAGPDPAVQTPVAPTVTPPPTTAAATVAVEVPPVPAAPPAPPSGPPGKLNVILITIDSLRADMPWTGYARDIAPNLTAFEKTAVDYTHAYSVSSYTAMSLPGMLAGRYPGELDRSGYFFSSYPESVVMFPELLHRAGVRTIGAHAHFYFDKEHGGLHHGFDAWEIVKGITANNKTDENITSPKHVELAERLLGDRANTEKAFFAWFHFMDPHDEYMPHEGIGPFGKTARDKYDGEVAFTDQHLGKLLAFIKAQPWAASTAIIISSDHGEAFGERKMHRHGFELYEMLIRVPLLIQAPGITPRKIDTPRSAIDLAPTILELEGVAADPSFQGKTLVPELYGKAPEPRDIIADLPRTGDNDRRRAFIHGTTKLIAWGDDYSWELFDLANDPLEEHDLKRKDPALFADMKQRYKDAVRNIHDVCPKHTDKLKGKSKGRRC